MRCTRGESGKETSLSQTLRNWNKWTPLKSVQKDSMQKEALTPMSGEKFIFPIADGTVKLSGSENIHLNPGSPRPRRRTMKSSWRIRRVFLNTFSRLMVVWRWCQEWFLVHSRQFYLPSSRGIQSQTIRAERRIISYSSEMYRRYQDYRYVLRCNVGEEHRWLLHSWWRSRIVRYVNRFHKIHSIEWKKLPDGYTWSGRRLTSQTQCGQRFGKICPITQREANVGDRETKAWQCQEIVWYLFHWSWWWGIQGYHEKTRVEKLEIPMPAAMLCILQRDKYIETCRTVEEHRTKISLYCWSRWICEETHGRISSQESRRSYCRQRDEFTESIQFGAQIYCYASSNENTRCKGRSGERVRNTRENPGMELTKGRNKKEVIEEGRVVLRGDIVKDDSGTYAVFTEQGSSATQMTAAKVMDIISRLPGCAGQAADAASAYTQVKMEDAPFVIENSKVRMSRYLDTPTTTQMA